MSDRDEKTAIGVPAQGTDRTMVRAKSTLSDAFSDRTIVYDPSTKPSVPPPPVAEAIGGAKQIRPPDTAALAVPETIAEEATDPGLEPVVKKPKKKKKAQQPAFNFARVDKRVLMGIGVGIAAVALVVVFGSPSDESSPRAEEPIVAQEEPVVQGKDLASVSAPPPKPAQVVTPPPSTDASTAQALEIFDQAVRRTQERASQKVEPYGF